MGWITVAPPKPYVAPDTWNPFAHMWAAKEFYDEKRNRENHGHVTSWQTGNVRCTGFVDLNGRVVHINMMYKSIINEDKPQAKIHMGHLVNIQGERLEMAD